jgi:hypothetical protein
MLWLVGWSLALLAAGMLLGLLAPSAAASSFTIVQPTQKYAGKTYGQWSAAWWQWAANISEPSSPVTDDTGADCAVNQNGPVWFLAGTTEGSATRRCTVPPGKAILVPIINGECSTVEGDGTTEAELRACAEDLMDHGMGRSCWRVRPGAPGATQVRDHHDPSFTEGRLACESFARPLRRPSWRP